MPFSTGLFIVILAGLAAATLGEIVKAFGRRRASRADLAHIMRELDRTSAALQEARAMIDDQAAQLAELQERVEFTERLLAQTRDRSSLGPGGK